MIPIVTISTYTVDCFRRKSASVTGKTLYLQLADCFHTDIYYSMIACNNFVRYSMAGVGALIATDMENALGSGIMYSMCAGIIALAFLLIIFVKVCHSKWKGAERQ